MNKSRFRFTIKGMLIAIALLAGPMLCLRQPTDGDVKTISASGSVEIRRDGSIEVHGGEVWFNQGNKQTKVQANRIVVQKDGTAEVYGHGTIVQTSH
jgi:hypothetical protein